jgi:hypothetical protein
MLSRYYRREQVGAKEICKIFIRKRRRAVVLSSSRGKFLVSKAADAID